jgi:FkbH-like protein
MGAMHKQDATRQQDQLAAREEWRKEKKVKCLVWDLDNTLWTGTLLEDPDVTIRDKAVELIRALDARGILHSIASRNDADLAMTKLREAGLDEYFIHPQINWGAKSASIQRIAEAINIGIDTLAFVDDQPFERDEVASVHPLVQCYDAADLASIADRSEMKPRFISDESRHRREMLQAEIKRTEIEESFEGAQDKFLASLGMHLLIHPAGEEDLERAEELTLRTNQLNTTGRTYSYDELNVLRQSDDHLLLVAKLDDKYGSYGTIGLALIEKLDREWWIRLLLMSCRVMNRGIGGALITFLRRQAKDAGMRLLADMIMNDRNRMMYMTYKFSHFREIGQSGDVTFLENDLDRIPPYPEYLNRSFKIS